MSKTLKLIISLAIPLMVGAIAGYFTRLAIPTWYASLNQPSFNPPNWIFGPVWTTIYVLMGISCFLIWRLPETKVRDTALWTYVIQLALNFTWSFLFFYFKLIGVALLEISVLWISILVMIIGFKKLKPLAAYLNTPYILWVSFALILNASYFFLNR